MEDGGCLKPSHDKEERAAETIQETKENILLLLISDSLTAGSRPLSRRIHYTQEVPPFRTISEFPLKGLLGWHNSSVPTH